MFVRQAENPTKAIATKHSPIINAALIARSLIFDPPCSLGPLFIVILVYIICQHGKQCYAAKYVNLTGSAP